MADDERGGEGAKAATAGNTGSHHAALARRHRHGSRLADRSSSLGGIIPALLSITGIIIWWRARKPRQKAKDYQRLMATAP